MELKNMEFTIENDKNSIKNFDNCTLKKALKPNLSNLIKKKSVENVDYIEYTYSIEVTKQLYYIFTFKVLKEENNINELEITSRVIVEFYKIIISYYQKMISDLNIYSLYKENDKAELEKLEELIRYISHFLTKIYYEYPVNEENEASKICDELMRKYHIKEQIGELRDKLNLIREISISKYSEEINNDREKWNKRFALIGILIAVVDIVCNFIH
ncbi:hypothetical protein [uncultured Sneathia sp.]|uniref:hypothetical protein n=1 Tax=uncultured Sneathia sp. TaxID=278067 RepID=UPI0025932519|nr:hypothetical protein [uncultured Sneathia sp.]